FPRYRSQPPAEFGGNATCRARRQQRGSWKVSSCLLGQWNSCLNAGLQWQEEGEFASYADLTLHADFAIVSLNKAPGNSEPEASAASRVVLLRHPEEITEDLLLVLRCDARSCIRHHDSHGIRNALYLLPPFLGSWYLCA